MRRLYVCVLLCVALCAPAWSAGDSTATQTLRQFQSANPGARVYWHDGLPSRVYGTAFGFGLSAEHAAESFVQDYSMLYGVPAEDLRPGNTFNDLFTQPVYFEPDTGNYRFTLVYFAQQRDGVPVYRAELRLLARNEPDYPLVLAASSLRPLGDFRVTGPMLEGIDIGAGHEAARSAVANAVRFGPPELTIWAGYDGPPVPPRLAVVFEVDNGLPDTADYQKWELVVDAATGEVLYVEDRVLNADIFGVVNGMSTVSAKADHCNPEESMAMPYAKVTAPGTETFADANGYFTLAYEGTDTVTVTSEVRGEWFKVLNQAGANSVLTAEVTPPGPAVFLHNAANTSEHVRAEINAYVQANVVRDYALQQNPSYPTIWNEPEFPVKVNLASTCNAYYDYQSINFYRSGGGCANTAFATVVHHEYGHHLVSKGGSGQGQYGEGMADCVAMLIVDDPRLAIGFYLSNCNSGIRSAVNDVQYPCSGEVHACGQLLSGCVWDAYQLMKLFAPPHVALDVMSRLTINSILVHTGTQITPQIAIDFLTLDDDDGNLDNGTPHRSPICSGFARHNMACPPLPPPPVITGDMNCDGAVDFDDIDPFVLALSGQDEYEAAYPGCDYHNADVDGDGDVDFDDIDPFVSLLG